MSIPDRLHSAVIREALNTARYEAGLRAKVVKLLNGLGRELVAEISDAGLGVSRTDWQRARLQKLLNLTQRRASEVYGEVEQLHTSEMQGLVEVASGRIVTACNAAIGAKLLQPLQWTEEQLASIVSNVLIEGAPSAEWWSRQAADLTRAFADQMRQGMARGETIQQLRDRIIGQNLPGVGAVGKVDLRTVAKADRGIIWKARRNAEAIVRTSAITINSAAHMAAFEANADVIEGLIWTSTLDQRTCLVAGTPVTTPSGSALIECLAPGDMVLGGSGEPRQVLGTSNRRTKRLVKITLSNGKTIKCTEDHQWLNSDQEWIEAKDLKHGDTLANGLK